MLIEIVDFQPEYRKDFKAIGEEWINQFMRLQEPDISILSDPQKHIIHPGGFIYFAKQGDEILGTAALAKKAQDRYELVKLGVLSTARGLGIGTLLCERVIGQAKSLGLEKLYLESSQKLTPALRLYRKLGFADINEANRTPQCDVQMALQL